MSKPRAEEELVFIMPSNELGTIQNEAPNNRMALGCAEGLAFL